MSNTFTSVCGSTSSDRLQSIEQHLGLQFPSTYRSFLLEHNACISKNRTLYTDAPRWGGFATIRYFYGDCDVFHYSLLANNDADRLMPASSIAIAESDAGCAVCMNIDATSGRHVIYLWDYYTAQQVDDPSNVHAGHMTKVAESFDELLTLLYE